MVFLQKTLLRFTQRRVNPRSNEELQVFLPDGDPYPRPREEWLPINRNPISSQHCFRMMRQVSVYLQCRLAPWKWFRIAIPLLFLSLLLLSGVPASFSDIWAFEGRLPQHDPGYAKAGGVKYLRLSNPSWGRGLNNILEESIITSYIAYASNRSFVFEDYVWSRLPFYTVYDFALRPSRMPLNAFISGPIAGGVMPGSTPRAVSSKFWDAVCPPEKIVVFDTMGAPDKNADALTIVNWWKEQLDDMPEECVITEVPYLNNVIDSGSDRITSLWPSLSKSPILKDFIWSPLVQSALLRNFAIFQPPYPQSLYEHGPNSTLSGMVAVHLRRGDFEDHCPYLAQRGLAYLWFNSFPGLLDRFDPPTEHTQRLDYYKKHCYPTIGRIVSRLKDVRSKNPDLRRVYVLTNARRSWLENLLKELKKDGWDDLKSTLDLQLDPQQSWVSNAIDMAIAEKAEVFLGNGFSSLTANVLMLRIAKGLDMSSNRLL